MSALSEKFLDDLCSVVDDETEALEIHAELLADSDEARDLVFEAGRLADSLTKAGADFEPIPDLEGRLLAAIEAEAAGADAASDPGAGGVEGAAPPEAAAMEQSARAAEAAARSGERMRLSGPAASPAPSERGLPSGVDVSGTHASGGAAEPHPAEPERGREGAAGAPEATSGRAQDPGEAPSGRASKPRDKDISSKGIRGKGIVIPLFGALLAAAAAAGLAFFGGEGTQPAVTTGPMAGPPLTATLLEATGPDGTRGVFLRPAGATEFAPLAGAVAIVAGSSLRTDARTRARVQLSDGSELVLDRASEVLLRADAARTLHLNSGQLLADVAHLEQGPLAIYSTPAGRIEVLGTKFVLATNEGQANVRVTRGAVRAVSGAGQVTVKAGEEGLLRGQEDPSVGPAVDLAASLAFSEMGEEIGDDLPTPGLGELRARRPGESEDRERPLTLAHHGVSVRIVGNVARTEIEETFRNESGDTLEGIYRFPLPANARIASLSLEVDGQWEQGAFVPKNRAQKIWRGVIRNATQRPTPLAQEEYIWVPGPWHDPALLEWQRGGRFELRIFPIPARGERRIRIAYEQTVSPHANGRRFTYPLAVASDDSTRVGRFEVDVRVAGAGALEAQARGYEMVHGREGNAQTLRYTADNFSPSGDLIVDYQMPGGERELRWWTYRGQATAAPSENSREGEA
ncbi:MAG: VIT domain-containing protein, partial [Myxococcales bacterium]|nr:VIT domain-containing protein [Myxococcales bacterium]